jgi:hypothetical protein
MDQGFDLWGIVTIVFTRGFVGFVGFCFSDDAGPVLSMKLCGRCIFAVFLGSGYVILYLV